MREILTALDGLAPGLSHRAMDSVHGHDDRWNGALDVRSLAAASVGLAAASAREFAGANGRPSVEITAALPEIVAAFASVSQLRIDGRTVPGFAPCSGFFRTADGWLRTHANYPHHRARLFHALGINHDDALEPALARLTSRDAESRIVAEGGVAARVVSESEWRREAPSDPGPWLHILGGDLDTSGRHRSPRPDGHPWRPVHPHAAGVPLPLHGVRVVSLTRVIAGPTAAKFLAALGADVIRVDPPAIPELLGQHLDTDLGVRCTSRDLYDPTAAADLAALLGQADVLLTGYRPGSLTALGLDAALVGERFPHLVHVELSAWEPTGPRAGTRGFDSIVQAATGIAHRYGSTDGTGLWRPGALPVQALDHATGYGMAAAACALLAAGRSGHARLSLERTARVLLDGGGGAGRSHPSPSTDPRPETVELTTEHGKVTCVPAPVRIDGRRPPVLPPLPAC